MLGLPEEVVQAVLADWRTAPVSEALRATLGFLEILTLRPADVDTESLAPLRAAGVPDEGIEEAVRVCFVFSVLDRLADTFDFPDPPPGGHQRLAPLLNRLGYWIASVAG